MPKIFLLLMIILSFVSLASAQFDFGGGSFRNPFDDLYSGSPLLEFHADILDNNKPRMMKDTLIIDFESRQVTFTRIDRHTGMSLWAFHYAEMEDFFRDIENHARNSLWNEVVRERGRAARVARGTDMTGLAFAVPANLPRWATRILGQEPPKLAITGTQKLRVGVQRDIMGTRQHPQKNRPVPEFRPTSNFNIKGTVGRLLTLEINLRGDGDDGYDFFEQARDQLSQVRIHYRESFPGELEDDIIQEVEIGRTSFQMPGHGLAGFASGSNENLFGIKVRSKFGPLEVTTIASIENVEHQRRTIRVGEARPDTMFEGGYIRNRFFFLDELFWRHSINNNVSVPRITPERVEVFRRVDNPPSDAEWRWAFHDGTSDEAHIFRRLRLGQDFVIRQDRPGVIQFLSHISDHDVIGILWNPEDPRIPQKGDPSDTMITVRTMEGETTEPAIRQLWLLKDIDDRIDPTGPPGSTRYDLMLRNVYDIGMSSQEDFSLEIFRSEGGILEATNRRNRHFTSILGLADENGLLFKGASHIFDLANGLMFIPPFATTNANLNPNWVFTNPELDTNETSNINSLIYNDAERGSHQSLFRIVTKSRRQTNTIHLDFGVVENSERLWTPAGDTLQRHIDYSIDYSFGQAVLLSAKALAADVIEVSYQRESLFLLDRKTFVGINALLNFPGIGRNSFLSTTLMWQLMDAKKMTPRVGTEPFNRFLFGSTVNFDFAPLWMTSAINLIPLIEREAQSTATFNVEVAYSQAKSAAAGGGEAFIDNFSTSARTVSLSLSHLNWHRAAPDNSMVANFIRNPPVWHQYWYLPATGDNRAGRNGIYPPDLTSSWASRIQDEKISTLRLVAEPFPEHQDLRNNISSVAGTDSLRPFAGITYPLSSHFTDRRSDRYFEFWVRFSEDRNGNRNRRGRGRLTIDFGEVSEDLSLDGGLPNGIHDFESFFNELHPGQDVGLDGRADEDEFWVFPNFSNPANPTWDTLRYNDPRLGEWRFDPSKDNWRIYDHNSANHSNRRFVNGTQGNDRADRENISGHMFNPRDVGFFRYIINLDAIDIRESEVENQRRMPFFNGFGADRDSGWVHIRIPIGFVPQAVLDSLRSLNAYQEAATPGWLNNDGWRTIRHVRMLWTGMANDINAVSDSLEFEGMQFVGNLWQEQIYEQEQGGAGDVTGQISSSILDSRTTSGYRVPQLKNRDTINGEQAVDYTLRLEIKNLSPSQGSNIVTDERSTCDTSSVGEGVFVSRRFEASQAMNLSNYRAIRFWATDNESRIVRSDSNWFVVRLGTDSLTFYEFRTRRLEEASGWNGAGFTIDLDDLTDLKLSWFNRHGERHGCIDISRQTPDGDYIRVYTKTRIAPNISNITWIAFGVQNNSDRERDFDVRINGFRATGIGDRSGWAARASMRLRWSDFIDNSLEFRYQDAGFRQMNQEILSDSRTQLSSGASSSIRMDRFFPDRLGLNIPLGGEVRAVVERPEIRPNSDINLRNEHGETDNLRDMAGDFGRFITGRPESGPTTLSEKYEMRGRSRTAFTSFRKNRRSERVGPRLTADRIGIDYSMNYSDSLARMGVVPLEEVRFIRRADFDTRYHAEITTAIRHSMAFEYDFSPSQEAIQVLSWQPFAQNSSPTLSRRIKNMSFNLLPERVIFNMFNVDYDWREFYSSIRDVIDTTGQYVLTTRPTEDVRMRHGMNVTYRPINPFVTINYNLGINRNFERFIRSWDNSGVGNFTREAVLSLDKEFGPYNILFSEHGRSQDITLSLTPEITRWLTVSSNSSGNYTQDIEFDNRFEDTTFMRTNITSTFNFTTQFFTRRLFEDIARMASKREGFSQSMSNVAKGFETVGFESVNFNYTASMRLANSRLDLEYLDYGLDRSTARFMLYSFGIYNRSLGDFITGNMNDAEAFGGVQNRNDWWGEDAIQENAADTRNTSQNFTVSTALRLPKPAEISINTISLGWTRTYNVTPIPESFDTTIIYPDFRLGMSTSALEQIEMINQNFSTFRIDWGYSFKRTERLSGVLNHSLDENNTISWGFTPLLRTNFRLRKIGLSFVYQLDLSFDTTHTHQSRYNQDSVWVRELTVLNERRTAQNSWTANYHVPGRRGRTMRIFRDQIIEINGDMDYSLSIRHSRTQHDNPILRDRTNEDQRYEDISLSILPEMTYRLTRNVDARVFYNLTRNIRGKSENLSHNAQFGMEVTISF